MGADKFTNYNLSRARATFVDVPLPLRFSLILICALAIARLFVPRASCCCALPFFLASLVPLVRAALRALSSTRRQRPRIRTAPVLRFGGLVALVLATPARSCCAHLAVRHHSAALLLVPLVRALETPAHSRKFSRCASPSARDPARLPFWLRAYCLLSHTTPVSLPGFTVLGWKRGWAPARNRARFPPELPWDFRRPYSSQAHRGRAELGSGVPRICPCHNGGVALAAPSRSFLFSKVN